MEVVKRYYNKKYFSDDDVARGVYDYHSVMGVALLYNGIIRNEKLRDTPFKFVFPFCCVGLGIVSFVFMTIHIFHCLDENNIPEASESFAYLIIVTAMIVQATCIFIGRNTLQLLGDMMDDDFAKMENLAPDYKEMFYKHQLWIKKLTIGWIIFVISILICFLGKTFLEILYQQLFMDYTKDKVRPFMFKLWIPTDDVYRTPNYEIFLFLEIFITFCVALVFGSYCLLHFHYNLHILGEFDLVILGWRKLFNFDDLSEMQKDKMEDEEGRNYIYDVLKKRIKEISIRHRCTLEFFEHVNNLFGPVLFYQLLLTSVALCITGFQIAQSIEKGQLDFLFLLLFVGALVQICVPCLMGSFILQKASDVGDECYGCGWETIKISNEIALDILFFIMMANKPAATKAMGLTQVSLETFSSIVQTAGSYFTMLRQVNEDVYK